MSRHDPPSGDYYYASGKPVRLTPDEEWIAVDTRLGSAADPPGDLEAVLRDASRPLRKDMVLVRRDALSSQQLDALARGGGIQPVFHVEGVMLVALPEVRVEESSPKRRQAVGCSDRTLDPCSDRRPWEGCCPPSASRARPS